MKGKVSDDYHPARQPEPNEVPIVISIDSCFLGRALEKGKDPERIEDVKTPSDEAEGVTPILVVYGHRSRCTFAGVVNKGKDPYAIAIFTDAFKFCGRQKSILMFDGKPSKALAEAASKSWGKEVMLRISPKGSHQSNGAVEKAILEFSRQVRAGTSAFEARLGLKVQVTDKYFPWLVKHSSWLLSRL